MAEKLVNEKSQVFKLNLKAVGGLKPGIEVFWGIEKDYFLAHEPNYVLIVWAPKSEHFKNKFLGIELVPVKSLSYKISLKESGDYKIEAFLLNSSAFGVRFLRHLINDDFLQGVLNRDGLEEFLFGKTRIQQNFRIIEREERFFLLEEKRFSATNNLKKVNKTIKDIFSLVVNVIVLVVYAIYLIIAPTIIFFFGYCPKKPGEIWGMFKKGLRNKPEDIQAPLEIRYQTNFEEVHVPYRRLIWYWGKKPKALAFSLLGFTAVLLSLWYIVFFIYLSQAPLAYSDYSIYFYLVVATISAIYINLLLSNNKEKFQLTRQRLGFKIMAIVSKIFFFLGSGFFALLIAILINYLIGDDLGIRPSELISLKMVLLTMATFLIVYYASLYIFKMIRGAGILKFQKKIKNSDCYIKALTKTELNNLAEKLAKNI